LAGAIVEGQEPACGLDLAANITSHIRTAAGSVDVCPDVYPDVLPEGVNKWVLQRQSCVSNTHQGPRRRVSALGSAVPGVTCASSPDATT
jgi:hypothetical protein